MPRGSVGGDERCLRLAVQDNGIGLPPALERSRPGHHGLSGMRDTAQAVGADLTLSCMPTDGGTQVAFVWRA
jgi:nitrate/nitrite-specific signal transduction histidine kinase